MACDHKVNHEGSCKVVYITDTGQFILEVRLECADCGHPFEFIGLPLGVNLSQPTMSIGGDEARLPVKPKGHTQKVTHKHQGFSIEIHSQDPEEIKRTLREV